MNKLVLSGCNPKPLASYLKAVGILRLIAEQKDSKAKGWWEGEKFVIKTNLTQGDFEIFFCEEYAPTPVVAPWNGGSGFYLGDVVDGIEAIAGTDCNRFAEYRHVISQIKAMPEIPSFGTVESVQQSLRSTLKEMRPGKKKDGIEKVLENIKDSAPPSDIIDGKCLAKMPLSEVEALSKDKNNAHQKVWRTWWNVIKKARTECNTIKRKENKKTILPRCRSLLSDHTLQWLDAVSALKTDGENSFNPILGTGGNEGRFEFSNSFMNRLTELFITGKAENAYSLFQSAIFNIIVPGLVKAKIGQFDPGRAGGYNQGMEIETKDFKINPWDFILAIEGAMVLAGSIARRNPTDERSLFTTPFTVLFSPVGFTSSNYEETGRQETWLPLWRNPASFPEIKYLFSEGRAAIGRRLAHTGIEFSRAVSTLGVDRGIDSFERFAFLERRGQSYVALPAGRIDVQYKPEIERLDELKLITGPVQRFIKGFKSVPAAFQSARRKLDKAVFSCSQRPDALNFSYLVRAVGNLEKLIAMRDRSKEPAMEKPLFGLSPDWISNCDDGSIEVRIAAVLASIRATGKAGSQQKVGAIRSNMAGVDSLRPWIWSEKKGDQYWFGNSLSERLAGVLYRRLIDAQRTAAPHVPIEAVLSISPYDVMPFLWGECDDTKLEELLWGFTLINWKNKRKILDTLKNKWKDPVVKHPLLRSWCVLKLLYIPGKLYNTEKKQDVFEPRIISLLIAGRIQEACATAIYRLRIAGLRPFDVKYEESADPVKLLASLLIPVKDHWELESKVLYKKG